MEQLRHFIESLSLRQKLTIAGVTLLVGIGTLLFVNARRTADYRPLYTNMAAEEAGAVVQKLKEKSIPYRLDEQGGGVLVPSSKVAEARIDLAAAGLPKTGRIGFELFDKTKFGASDLTEKVNLRRAVEGELERSVSALSEVDTARVHVTYPRDSVFAENRLPAKASVLVKLKPGMKLEEQGVSAVRFLVASAVEGLTAEAVSVLDMEGHVLGRPRDRTQQTEADNTDASLEYRRKIEHDLMARMDETVEALLGPGRYRTSLVAECDFSSGEQSEESYDPNRSVMTTSEKTRESSNGVSGGGVPGTASNLPRPAPPVQRSNGYTRETENINFQTARTVRRMRLPQGKITRLSASVLVDQNLQWVPDGRGFRRVLTPAPPETLRRISELVSAAIGLETQRGDRLVVDSLPFETTLSEPPPTPIKAPQGPLERILPGSPAIWIGVGGAVLVMVAMGAGVKAAFRKKRRINITEPAQGLLSDADAQAPDGEKSAPEDNMGTQLERQLKDRRRKRDFERQQLQAEGAVVQDLIKELQETAKSDPELCAGAMRSWLLAGTEKERVAARPN